MSSQDRTPVMVPMAISRANGMTKWILGALALLIGYAAWAKSQYPSFVLSLFMIAVLHVPVTARWTPPNWGRYLAYFILAVAFVALWGEF